MNISKSFCTLIWMVLSIFPAAAQWPGTIDSAFAGNIAVNGSVYALAADANGGIIIGGDFTIVNGQPRKGMARLDLQGHLDVAFVPAAQGNIRSLLVQPDGKILVAGLMGSTSNAVYRCLRLTTSGATDPGFATNFANGEILALALQTDGKILAAGGFNSVNGNSFSRLIRLNSDGSVDGGFAPPLGFEKPIRSVAVLGDGRIILGGSFSFVGTHLTGLSSNGDLDPKFNNSSAAGANPDVYALALQPDGKLLAGGAFESLRDDTVPALARFTTGFDADPAWHGAFQPGAEIHALALQNGRIIAGGIFHQAGSENRENITRLNADGSVDLGFDPGSGINGLVRSAIVTSDGGILLGGDFSLYNGTSANYLVKVVAADPSATAPIIDQQPVPIQVAEAHDAQFAVKARAFPLPSYQWTFNNQPIPGATGSRLTLYNVTASQKGSYAVIVSNALGPVTSTPVLLDVDAQTNAPGILDSSFVISTTNLFFGVPHLQQVADGTVFASGVGFTNASSVFALTRLQSSGAVDSTVTLGTLLDSFNVSTFVVQPDGKIVVGTFANIYRLNTNGTSDTGFKAVNLDNGVVTMVLQPDGKILIGGWFTSVNNSSRSHLARLNADGSVDQTFSIGDGAGDVVRAMAVQTNGAILAGGWFTNFSGEARGGLVRLLPAGGIDHSFSNPFTNAQVTAIGIQTDSKIVVEGLLSGASTGGSALVVRLNADGQLDTAFTAGRGITDPFNGSIAFQNGQILLGGTFTNVNGSAHSGIVRMNSNGTLDETFIASVTPPAVTSLVVANDGKILVAGNFTNVDGATRIGLARLITSPAIVVTIPKLFGLKRLPGSFEFSFASDAGRIYDFQSKDSMGGSWITVGSITGNGSVLSAKDTNAVPIMRFYRLRVR